MSIIDEIAEELAGEERLPGDISRKDVQEKFGVGRDKAIKMLEGKVAEGKLERFMVFDKEAGKNLFVYREK